MSRNKNLYTIEEMEHIAKEAEGKPMFFGTVEGVNPNTGTWSKQLHDERNQSQVGKIISTVFNALKRKVTFVAEVANTEAYPDLLSKLKAGWGVSIGGIVKKAQYVVNKNMELCVKIKDMIVQHVSLVPPEVVRGQDEAKVEHVKIQECMIFDKPEEKILFIIEGKGVKIKNVFLE
jgi:hypothetical protein